MFMDVKKHLLERYLNPDLYTVSWDDETASFALWNLSGQWCGYQQYRPFAPKTLRNDPRGARYFTWAKDRLVVWGLESWDFRKDVLFVTEGVFVGVIDIVGVIPVEYDEPEISQPGQLGIEDIV